MIGGCEMEILFPRNSNFGKGNPLNVCQHVMLALQYVVMLTSGLWLARINRLARGAQKVIDACEMEAWPNLTNTCTVEKPEPNTSNMSPARLPKNHPLSVHLKFKLELVDVKCLWQLKLNHRNAFEIWNTEMHHQRALILLEISMQMLIKGQDWYISADAHKSGTVTSRSMHLRWLCLSACLSACLLCLSLSPIYMGD